MLGGAQASQGHAGAPADSQHRPAACKQRCLPPSGRVPAIMSPAEWTSRVHALWAEPSCPSVLFMSLKMAVLSH